MKPVNKIENNGPRLISDYPAHRKYDNVVCYIPSVTFLTIFDVLRNVVYYITIITII